MIVHLPRALATLAVRQLATVDYTVANRVTERVADVVEWSYAHDLPWIARDAVVWLQTMDELGGLLIALAVWVVAHVD